MDLGTDLRECAEDAASMTPVDMALLGRLICACSDSSDNRLAELERAVSKCRSAIPSKPRSRRYG